MSRIRGAWWLWLLPCAIVAQAGEPPTPPRVATVRPLDLLDLGAPAFANFTTRDGLPAAVTVSVRTDRDGFVWVASPDGVARYDGRRWVASDDPAMAHSVDSLWVDHEGTLWAAFRNHGLARYDGRRWHVENRRTGLPSDQVRRFAETRDAGGNVTLWALTWDRGLMQLHDGHWIADPDNDSLPRGAVLAMAQTTHLDGVRRTWIGTGDQGLWYRDEGRPGWRRWHTATFDPAQVEYLLAVGEGAHEELWISVFGAGLWQMSDAGLRVWNRAGGELPTDSLYDIAQAPLPDGGHALWIASRSGLIRLHEGHVQVFDRRHGLPSDVIRGLNVWRSPNGDDVVWLATEAGVSRTTPSADPWLTASLMGARSTGVFAVRVEPDGEGGERLWVGSSDEGIGLYEHGRWRTFSAADGTLPGAGISMITATGSGEARVHWIGLWSGDLLRVREGPVFELQATPWPRRAGEAVLDFLERRVDGVLEQWVATRRSGIYRLRAGRWTAFGAPQGDGPWRVGRLADQVDDHGRSWLWAATDRGLARFDGSRWDLFGHAAGLPDSNLLGLQRLDDDDGRPVLWLGTTNAGVARVDIADPHHPVVLTDNLPAPPDPTVYSALRDSEGRVYLCTNNGVQQLTPTANGYVSRVFTRRDGMVHDECNTNAQFIDAHDRYWTGTLGGLAVYDPRRQTRDTRPKALKIVGVKVDGKPRDGASVRVEADAKEIDIDFALLSWQRESESRFRTWLLGYEPAPGEWNAQASRSFNALPPGDYRLRIEARDYAGNPSTPIELPIVIAARWWQRTWASIAGVFALLLLGYAAALLRTRALKAQRRTLERRVIARTAELNEANARLVELSYLDALTGLANRRRLLELLEQAPGGAAATPTALVFVDVDHFKDYNDRFGHPAGDEALRCVAAAMRECAPADACVARYGGEEFACLLPHTSTADAVALAERIREAVAARDIPVPGAARSMRVTLSAGVASAPLGKPEDAHALLRDADMALYQAKREGRNRVCASASRG